MNGVTAPVNRELGKYLTAYATDLDDPALMGQSVVLFARYLSWDPSQRTETCADATGEYVVHPNPVERVGSAGPRDHVLAAEVVGPREVREITWWSADDVLRMRPAAFAAELALVWPS